MEIAKLYDKNESSIHEIMKHKKFKPSYVVIPQVVIGLATVVG